MNFPPFSLARSSNPRAHCQQHKQRRDPACRNHASANNAPLVGDGEDNGTGEADRIEERLMRERCAKRERDTARENVRARKRLKTQLKTKKWHR